MSASAHRYPDFLIIGAMKAGTTSLFTWLGGHPDVFVPQVKEPNFFSDEHNWARGWSWYGDIFAAAAPAKLVGEASVAYTAPDVAPVAAHRIAAGLTKVKLVFIARDPADRLRSHYRHEVLRGREHRPFGTAVRDLASVYVRRSMYSMCMAPYLQVFPPEQIHVARFESLFGPDTSAWHNVTSFLGLRVYPRPSLRRNASSERQRFTPLMRILWDLGVKRPGRGVPASLRRPLRPLFLREPPFDDGAVEVLPRTVARVLAEDEALFARLLKDAGIELNVGLQDRSSAR